MKKKETGSINTLLIAIIVILLLALGFLLSKVTFQPVVEEKQTPSHPELTQQQAETLVLRTWGGCTQDTCVKLVVTTEEKGDAVTVTATYGGLYDDSVAAQRKIAPAIYTNGVWTLGVPVVTHRCQQNRGHQDFSTELCV